MVLKRRFGTSLALASGTAESVALVVALQEVLPCEVLAVSLARSFHGGVRSLHGSALA